MNRKTLIRNLVFIFLLLKIGYLLFGVSLSQIAKTTTTYSFNAKSYNQLCMQKDAYWYQQIAENGYPVGVQQADGQRLLAFTSQQSSWAFFPAFPFINRTISKIFSVSYETAAFVSTFIFSMLALLGYFLFCEVYWKNASKAFWSTLILFLFPFHFYFSMFLTEAPFFAIFIWCFYCVQQRKLFLAALLMCVLVLLRPQGVVLLLPIFLYYLEQEKLLSFTSVNFKKLSMPVLIFVPASLVFLGHLYYQHELTGHYLAFSAAQKGWGKDFMFPLFALFRSGDLNYQITSIYVVIIISLLIWKRKKLPLSLMVLALISILLPLSAGSTYSMMRYGSVIFPIFLIISELFFNLKYKSIFICFLAVLHFASFYFWVVDHPLGF